MNELELLKREVEELKQWRKNMSASHSIPLENDVALRERLLGGTSDILSVSEGGTGLSTITGIPLGAGISALTPIVPKSGQATFYVAASSGGAVTTKVDINYGIITAIT